MRTQPGNRSLAISLLFARLLYLALFAAGIYFFIASLPKQVSPETYICTREPCGFETVMPSELEPLRRFGLTPQLYIQYRFWTDSPPIMALFLGISLLIFLLRSDEWVSLLAASFLVTFPLTILASGVVDATSPWQIPWMIFSTIGPASLIILFYVFPDGKFAPGWTRWLALAAFSWSVAMRAVQQIAPLLEDHPLTPLLGWVYFLFLMAAFASQIYRYRRVSSLTQRQQTKWVVTAAIMMPLSDLVIRGALNTLLPWANQPGAGRVVHYMITIPLMRTIPFMMVPVSFAFAILRYRLWDIDLLIRRTLQYSLLTALLAGGYFSSILLLQAIFSTMGGSPTELTTVVSTLAFAALFSPLRRRIQEFIDRRFYRRKFDAEKALAEFASAARSGNDLSHLSKILAGTVHYTMQPEQLSLWLKPILQPDRLNTHKHASESNSLAAQLEKQ